METDFRRVVVIGYGKATGDILKYVDDQKADYGYSPEFIEHEPRALSVIGQICKEREIPYACIPDKKELGAYLGEITEETLVLSASNNFLFPASVVERENITIINFHNALLPDYPGRNAPSWVIYQGETQTGITWHYVTAGVDEGSIIIQKTCEIGPDMKAYELTEQLMDLACEGFYECFAEVLAKNVQARPQDFSPDRRMYRSTQVPGDGFLDLEKGAGGAVPAAAQCGLRKKRYLSAAADAGGWEMCGGFALSEDCAGKAKGRGKYAVSVPCGRRFAEN